MDKLTMHTPNLADENYAKLAALFPNAVTESIDPETGEVVRAIDKDVLMQEINTHVVEGREERYQFTWPDKRKAVLAANAPISAALRPVRADSVGKDGTPGGWDSENLYIEGDNLDVLKLLRETYLGKVKMIYIDPPYNTGNDFVYPDDFAEDTDSYMARSGQYDEQGNRLTPNPESNGRFHTDWLNMMYPRLRVAKDLLAEDGVIFISIDETEVANLRKISDEVFGSPNYAGEIIWKNSSKNDEAYITIQHEYILCYVKSKSVNRGEWSERKEGVDEIFAAFEKFHQRFGNDWKRIHQEALKWYKQFPESNPIYDSKHYSWMDERGVYFPDNISGPNYGQYRYDVIHPITNKVCKEPSSGWRYPESTMKQRIANGLVHFGKDETTVPNNKTYLSDTVNQSLTSMKYRDGRVASKALTALMGSNCFSNPKDPDILVSLMQAIHLKDGDIVLDFFSGSGSTAEAAMMLAKRAKISVSFILVQIQENLDNALLHARGSAIQIAQNAISLCDAMKAPHNLCEIGKERIRRAGRKIKEEAGLTAQDLDIGFRVLRLDSSNMQDVYYNPAALTQSMLDMTTDNIKPDRTPEDLLFQVMLELGVPLSSKIAETTIDGHKVFDVADGFLLACFDAGVTTETVTAIAKRHPYYAVFRDSSLQSDSVAANFEQIFEAYSPTTVRKVL